MRGATSLSGIWLQLTSFQSTLPLRGATADCYQCCRFHQFQSTLPLRGATTEVIADRVELIISIHAPLAGSDLPIATLTFSGSNFNPRSPCGERPTTWEAYVLPRQFQSTLPLRGATPCKKPDLDNILFQSTLPLRGATLLGDPLCQWTSYFNPRSPCGERRRCNGGRWAGSNFNPRSPCGERQS